MRKISYLMLKTVLMLVLIFFFSYSRGTTSPATAGSFPELNEEQLAPISEIVEKAIREKQIPGAVILVGNKGRVIYRKAFGYRSLVPDKHLMTLDTIFDISSVTKVVATTTAVMQLVEKGKLNLEDRAAKYWPEFKVNGKQDITVRQLLTHYSGLRPDLKMQPYWSGYGSAMKKILSERPKFTPGKRFVYSDINFEILGELVKRLSGKPLDLYSAENIFKPLGMNDTLFNPSSGLHNRIAPTEYIDRTGRVLTGEVHDATARRMGGVSGHAGLFSTADDLSVFAGMILNNGGYNGVNILSSASVKKMTTPQSPKDKKILRGLGWDIDSPFSCNRGECFPIGSFGHSGYTGVSIWIDPFSETYLIILTNRVHPDGRGDAKKVYKEVATTVGRAIAGKNSAVHKNKVEAGIDVLKKEKFLPLSGLRVGLITNHSGLNSSGQRTLDLLHKARGVKLKVIFSPEHGLFGNIDEVPRKSFTNEPKTGLRVYNLYGKTSRPTDKMLKGLDALVFDMQDAGVRFYTYITTMAYAMETAAKKGIAFYVLDRPNPITASVVQGPVTDKDFKSFTGYFPVPVRHGMTVGELAGMFNSENRIGVKLHVIKMQGYRRTDWFDETGLQWVNPSPNLRTLNEAALYPGVAMVEGSNVSVGRGTDTPFEFVGAPWIKANELSSYLNSRKIQGVRFMPADFTPTSSRFANQVCHGIQLILIDRQSLDPTALGIEIASALYRLYPEEFQIDRTLDLIAARWIVEAIKNGQDPNSIVTQWQNQLEQFVKLRSKYLLY